MKVTVSVIMVTLAPKSSNKEEKTPSGPVAIESQHFFHRASDPEKCYLSAQIMLIRFIHVLNRENV